MQIRGLDQKRDKQPIDKIDIVKAETFKKGIHLNSGFPFLRKQRVVLFHCFYICQKMLLLF